jgi:DNA helicase MCM8
VPARHQPQEQNRRRTLAESLRQSAADQSSFDALPTWLLRKYIAYAKRYVHPRLTRAAKSVLQEFYLTLRRDHQSVDGTPITTRQLESMVRLAQARAKVELREVVTSDDALDVVDVMKESLYDVFADDDGFVDFRRATGSSSAAQTSAFMHTLHRKSKQRSSNVFTIQEMQSVATSMGLQVANFKGFIDTLNQQNYILQRGGNKYAVQSIE